MKHPALIIAALIFLTAISCSNGIKLEAGTYRAIAEFAIPADDTASGSRIFSPSFTLVNAPQSLLERIDTETACLRLENAAAPEAYLEFRLQVDGLAETAYGNIKVTAAWTPLDSASEGFVRQILFDKFAFMVLSPNNGSMQYDPSEVIIRVRLNTLSPVQAGILNFNFEFAKSVYDASACPSSYAVFLSSGASEKPRAIFSRLRPAAVSPSLFLSGRISSYAAEYVDRSGLEIASPKKVSLILDMLNIEDGHPVTLRAQNGEAVRITNIAPVIRSGHVGSIAFDLEYAAGSTLDGVEGSAILIVEDAAGYYAGLPFELPVRTLRRIPSAPNLQGAFTADGSASPWKWRVQYRVDTSNRNPSTASSRSQDFNSGRQNEGNNIISKYTSGFSTYKEDLVKTEGGAAKFIDSYEAVTNNRLRGDVLATAGWLFSDVFEAAQDFEYKLSANFVVGPASASYNDPDGDRLRLYLVPLANESADFTLSNANGSANLAVTAASVSSRGLAGTGTVYYFDIPAGSHNFAAVFSSDRPTKMRVIVEKGAPDWGAINNSKMASAQILVDNVRLEYK